MSVRVNEPWNEPGPIGIDFIHVEPGIELRYRLADVDDAVCCNEHLPDPQGLRSKDGRILDQGQHGSA